MCVLVIQLLELLPPTVGGLGQQLIRASQPKLTGKTLEEKRRETKRLANLVGFIVVVSNTTFSKKGLAYIWFSSVRIVMPYGVARETCCVFRLDKH